LNLRKGVKVLNELPMFLMPLDQIQPSQLYISAQKLAQVMVWWEPPRLVTLTPVPIKRLNGRVIYTDGHTRAFAAYQRGFTKVPVVWDEDELDWEAYQICVDWCLEVGIHTVIDLQRRVIPPETYERLWLGRCRRMHDRLEAEATL
jgi:hypothetical protein